MLSASEIVTIVVIVLVAVILGLGLWALWASNDNSNINQQYCGTGYDANLVNQQAITNGETFDALTRKYSEIEDIEKLVEFFSKSLKEELILVNLLFMYMFLIPHVVFNFTKYTGQPLGDVEMQSTPPANLYPEGSYIVPAPNNFLYAVVSPPPTANSPVVRPNYNTLYNELFVDLPEAPVLINLPSFGKRQKNGPTSELSNTNRFWLLQSMSSWSDAFDTKGTEYYNNIGKSDLLDKPMQYIVTGPSWRLTHLDQCIAEGGPLAKMLEDPEVHIQCPTDYGYILLRILMKSGSDSDKKIVNDLQRQCKAYTLGDSDVIEKLQQNYLKSPWLQTVLADFNQDDFVPGPAAPAPTPCWNPNPSSAPTPAPVAQCPPVPSPPDTAPSSCDLACQIELRRLCKLHPEIMGSRCDDINNDTLDDNGLTFNESVVNKIKSKSNNTRRSKLSNLFKRKPKTIEGFIAPNNQGPKAFTSFYQALYDNVLELDYKPPPEKAFAGVYGSANAWVAAAPSQLIFNITMNSIWGTGQFYGTGYNYPDPNGLLYDKFALFVWSNFGFNPYNSTLLNAFNTDMLSNGQQELMYPGEYTDQVRKAWPDFQILLQVVWESNYYQDGWVYMSPWIGGGYEGVYKNFIHRQLIVNNGFGANWTYYATYPTSISDNRVNECGHNNSDVVKLGPNNTSAGIQDFANYTNLIPCNIYKWTIPAELVDKLVEDEGFWSITMYSAVGTQTPNVWAIYDISSYSTKELKYEENGDLVFWMAYNAQKYIDEGKNVLPLPPPNFGGSYLTPSFRLYYPQNEAVGNLVRAGAKPTQGGDIMLPIIEFVENDPTLGTSCEGLSIQWGHDNIDNICPPIKPPGPPPDYMCCSCPEPSPVPSPPASTDYIMEIDTFSLQSDNQSIYGETPPVPPPPSVNNYPMPEINPYGTITENFTVDTPYNMTIKYPAEFNLDGNYMLDNSLFAQSNPVWSPQVLADQFNAPAFISAPYVTPDLPFNLTFSTTTPWNQPWLVPVYVANIVGVDGNPPVTLPTIVSTMNGTRRTSSGTLKLQNSTPPLTFQVYMVPVDLSTGSATLSISLTNSVVVMLAGIVKPGEEPNPPSSPAATSPIPYIPSSPQAYVGPSPPPPQAYVGPSPPPPQAYVGPSPPPPQAYVGPVSPTPLPAPTHCGPICQNEIDKICRMHPNIPGCPPPGPIAPMPPFPPGPSNCGPECQFEVKRLCKKYNNTLPICSGEFKEENFDMQSVGCQTIGCDNSMYCTNGQVQSGIAYYMGPDAKCSGSRLTCEDNDRILSAHNSNCANLVELANVKNSHQVEYKHFCPKTMGTC